MCVKYPQYEAAHFLTPILCSLSPPQSVQTYLDKVVEEHSSHGGQSEPDKHGKCGDIGNVQRMQQMRTDNRGRLAEEERHEETLEDVPGYLCGFLWQRRYRATSQRGASRGAALKIRRENKTLVENKMHNSISFCGISMKLGIARDYRCSKYLTKFHKYSLYNCRDTGTLNTFFLILYTLLHTYEVLFMSIHFMGYKATALHLFLKSLSTS